MDARTKPGRVGWDTFSIVSLTALAMLAGGIPLALLPIYVHDELGYGSVLAGLTVSAQFLATVVTRPVCGRLADRLGAKPVVRAGLLVCASGGLLLWLATLVDASPAWSLGLLLASRAALGAGLGFVGTGSLSWGIGLAGAQNTARFIAYNGVAAYGGIALGAPLGIALSEGLGLWSAGVTILLLGVLGAWLAARKRPSAVVSGPRLQFGHVLRRVGPFGAALALGSIGFGTLASFVTLYFAHRGWNGAAWCLTAFGAGFITARLLFAGAINRFGGFPVAFWSLGVEIAGLLLLSLAWTPALALIGSALTGLGLSLVYPALGVIAVARAPVTSRGAALSAYSLFMDISLGLTGPTVGALVGWLGYWAMFPFAAVAAAGALALALRQRRAGRRTTPAAA